MTKPNETTGADSASALTNGLCEPHAVRWAQREIRSRHDIEYSAWHWTLNASMTLCGRTIQLIADGPALLPETRDDADRVTCKRCRRLLAHNAEITGG